MSSTDPNLGLNYGWTLGESGWDTGMDANLKRLGAVVEAFDVRSAAKEEVLSLGAKFVEVEGAADASKAAGHRFDHQPQTKSFHIM